MHLVKNNNTGTLEISMFCPECMLRFGIFPYDKREMPDAKEADMKPKSLQFSGDI